MILVGVRFASLRSLPSCRSALLASPQSSRLIQPAAQGRRSTIHPVSRSHRPAWLLRLVGCHPGAASVRAETRTCSASLEFPRAEVPLRRLPFLRPVGVGSYTPRFPPCSRPREQVRVRDLRGLPLGSRVLPAFGIHAIARLDPGRVRGSRRCRREWPVPGSFDFRAFIHRRVCDVRHHCWHANALSFHGLFPPPRSFLRRWDSWFFSRSRAFRSVRPASPLPHPSRYRPGMRYSVCVAALAVRGVCPVG